MDLVEPIKKLNMNSANLAEEWKEFRQEFHYYIMVPEVRNKAEPVKVAMLLNAIGPDGVKVYNKFNLTQPQKNNLNHVLKQFDKYFNTLGRKQLYDTYVFEERRQGLDESFDTFVDDLKRLVKFCGYQNEDRMIRDRIVFGALDRQLKNRYFTIEDLYLNQVVEMGREAEKKRMVSNVGLSRRSMSMEQLPYQTKSWLKAPCKYCNLGHPLNGFCTAFGIYCLYCNRRNHTASACHLKREHEASMKLHLDTKYGRMPI